MIESQKLEKQTFKWIFEEYFEKFKEKYPRYQIDYLYRKNSKMIRGWAEEVGGYVKYKYIKTMLMAVYQEYLTAIEKFVKSDICICSARRILLKW